MRNYPKRAMLTTLALGISLVLIAGACGGNDEETAADGDGPGGAGNVSTEEFCGLYESLMASSGPIPEGEASSALDQNVQKMERLTELAPTPRIAELSEFLAAYVSDFTFASQSENFPEDSPPGLEERGWQAFEKQFELQVLASQACGIEVPDSLEFNMSSNGTDVSVETNISDWGQAVPPPSMGGGDGGGDDGFGGGTPDPTEPQSGSGPENDDPFG